MADMQTSPSASYLRSYQNGALPNYANPNIIKNSPSRFLNKHNPSPKFDPDFMSDYKQRILNRVNNVDRLKHNQQQNEDSYSRPGSWELDNPVDVSFTKNNNKNVNRINEFETIRQSRMSDFSPISKGAFEIVKENAVAESLSSLPSRKNN